MGTSRGNFVKYPRTPHLFGATGTPDDKRMSEADSIEFIADESLIVEEKIDGTNVGIHIAEGELILQCRGHLITEGMHPQYDLFKQWAHAKRNCWEEMLGEQFILFGEWLYAKHTIAYRRLPHYFFEFDIYDKQEQVFLPLQQRLERLQNTGVETVPVVHQGKVTNQKELTSFIAESKFDSEFIHPVTGRPDTLMEGIYLRIESETEVTARAKMVRPEFVDSINQNAHWQHQEMVPNELEPNADIWS